MPTQVFIVGEGKFEFGALLVGKDPALRANGMKLCWVLWIMCSFLSIPCCFDI